MRYGHSARVGAREIIVSSAVGLRPSPGARGGCENPDQQEQNDDVAAVQLHVHASLQDQLPPRIVDRR
jgi:hypothetical protein